MKVKIKKAYPDVKTPAYATDGSGCFDIHAYMPDNEPVDMMFRRKYAFHTGLKIEVPEGFVLLIFSRSGQGFNYDTRLSNCVGVIDSDYRGELKVKLTMDHSHYDPKYFVKHGDAIAQGMIVPIPKVEFDIVDELSTTDRGEGGFGSTDKIPGILCKQAG